MQQLTDSFGKYNVDLMVGAVNPVLFLLFFIFALFIFFYNWLYLSRTLHAHSQVGLNSPNHIDYLVKISSLIALFTAVLILFFLIIEL